MGFGSSFFNWRWLSFFFAPHVLLLIRFLDFGQTLQTGQPGCFQRRLGGKSEEQIYLLIVSEEKKNSVLEADSRLFLKKKQVVSS